MAKLPKLTGKELAKLIEKLGFVHSHTTGSHMIYSIKMGEKQQFRIMQEKRLVQVF